MKRFRIFLVIAMVAAILMGCNANRGVELQIDGYHLTVYTENGIVASAKDQYRYYIIKDDVFKTTVKIYYPNGAVYSRTMNNAAYFSSNDVVNTEGDYDELQHVPGEVLTHAVIRARNQKAENKETWLQRVQLIAGGILLIPLSLFFIYNPEGMWHLGHFLTVDGGEPSEFYLIRTKVSGILLLIVGVAFILFAIFM